MARVKILYLGNKLNEHGFTPTSVETLGERLKADFDVKQYSSIRNSFLRLLHFWWAILRWGKTVEYILIDTYSTTAFHYAWTSALWANFMGVKYVPILHGGNLPSRAKRSPRLLSFYLRRAFVVVCPSRYLQVEMEKHFSFNSYLIPNYIDIENYPYREKSLSGGIHLLWVRSFHQTYNPQLAVRVLAQLRRIGYPDATLCMVGPDKDGSMNEVQKLAEELQLQDAIKITGRLSKSEWIELSKDYNLFINTTNVDNTPVSVMEAMALGFPVISTNVGGIPYLIDSTDLGIVVPPNSADRMVESILDLKKQPDRCKIISKSARNKSDEWDWTTVRIKWIKLLT